jgi:hypothetical protein
LERSKKTYLEFDRKKLSLYCDEIEELLNAERINRIPRMKTDIISCWIVMGNDAEMRKTTYDFRSPKILFCTTSFFPEVLTHGTRSELGAAYTKRKNTHVLSGYSHVVYPVFYEVSIS